MREKILQKKKCKLISDNYRIENQCYETQNFIFTARVDVLGVGEILLKCVAEFFTTYPTDTSFQVYLIYPDGSKFYNPVIISNFEYKDKSVWLKVFELPESLKGMGLGAIVFSVWLKILYLFSYEYGLTISTIHGIIADGGNFKAKYSKKLYWRFNKFEFGKEKCLVLNKKEFKHNRLEYTIEKKGLLFFLHEIFRNQHKVHIHF